MVRKAQTAIELLTVYGWVVLLILVVFIVAYYSGYLEFSNVLPQYCNMIPTMSCSTYKFGFMPDGKTMTLLYKVVNGMGYDIYFSNNSVSLTVDGIGKAGRNVYKGSCYPNSVPIRPGSPISCIVMINDTDVVPSLGKNLDFSLSMKYRNCEASESYKTNRNCSTAPEYTIGGTIRAQLEPKGAGIFTCGDEVCEYEFGETPDNCCGDCPVYNLVLNVDPNPAGVYQETNLTAYATYSDGSAAANATVLFNKSDFNPDNDDFEPFSNMTNASGFATSSFSTNATGFKTLTATTCGATASVNMTVIEGAPNGAIIFSKSPDSVDVGGTYNINVTVYDSSGSPISDDTVSLTSDVDSIVTPNATQCPASCKTDSNGILQSNFSSNVLHVGRLKAKSQNLGLVNWTNPVFQPPTGKLLLWVTGATGRVGSEGYVQISGCLYDTNGQGIGDATLNLTTDLGYFVTPTGTKKLPSLGSFTTQKSTYLSCAVNTNKVTMEPFATSGPYIVNVTRTADPIEIDEYAGRFVRLLMTPDSNANSSNRSKAIADYIKFTGTNGRRVYIFYNSSYNQSDGSVAFVYPEQLFKNLTQIDLPSHAIPECIGSSQTDCFQSVSDVRDLKYIMLNKANTTILINTNEMFPVEVWNCEVDGGIPKKFFERGGIEIHTGEIEFWYDIYPGGSDVDKLDYCGNDGRYNIFTNWVSHCMVDTSYYTMTPIATDKTIQVTTGVGGCFNYTTGQSTLYSTQPGTAHITATYYSVSNSTTATFIGIPCSDGTLNGTCSSTKPKYCINGFLLNRCDPCDKTCTTAPGKQCDPVSGSCVTPAGPVILTVKSFNGTGTWLPNDNYSLIEVIAQVKDANGVLMDDIPVTWEVGSPSAPDYTLEIVSVPCARTGYGCGDNSSLPTPASPRAAVFIKSKMSQNVRLVDYTAYVNATATVYGSSVINSTNIQVKGPNVTSTKWAYVSPYPRAGKMVLPADNYTVATICTRTFNFNDSAIGNVTVSFNTTLGTFSNDQTNKSLRTDAYGMACVYLKSDTDGTANVTFNVTNWDGAWFTGYFDNNITFYAIPTSIIITPTTLTAAPCADCTDPAGWLGITATLKSGSNPIAGVPYVYFRVPRDNYKINSSSTPLVWFGDAWFDAQTGYGFGYGKMKPGYTPTDSICSSISQTNGTCSNSTNSSGSTSTRFGPVYPPGQYNIEVSVWYDCDSEPFSPLNCQKNVSNVTLMNITPVQQRIIFGPSGGPIPPDGKTGINVTTTMYGSNGSVLPNVWCHPLFQIIGGDDTRPSPVGLSDDTLTDSYGNCSLPNIVTNIPGNYSLRFRTSYFVYNTTTKSYSWVVVDNYTTVRFTMVGSILINKSTDFAYADGRTCPNVTITVLNTSGGPMSNVSLRINPLKFGAQTGGVISCPTGQQDPITGICSTYTNSSGQFNTTVCSSQNGTANFSVYVRYAKTVPAPAYMMNFSNSTNIYFMEPPTSAQMTTNTSSIWGDGVDRALFKFQLRNSTGPTPGVPVACYVSDNAVFYPFSNLVTDLNGNVTVNVSANAPTTATLMCIYYGLYSNVVANKDVTVTPPTQPGKYLINVTASPPQQSRNINSTVTANVTNSSGPVPGVQVNFSTSWGGILNGTLDPIVTVWTNGSGIAKVNATMSTNGSIFVKASITSAAGTDFGTVKIKYT